MSQPQLRDAPPGLLEFFVGSTGAQVVRVLLFCAVVATVYVLAAGMLWRWLREKATAVRSSRRRPRWSAWCIGCLATLGSLCITYGYFVEPYWPEITHVKISNAKSHGASRPVRIVHLSDLHSDTTLRLEERLPGLVADLKPDLIVFTGDALNSDLALPAFKLCMTRLAAIAPVYAVRGNWDAWYWKGLDLFGGTGAVELDGRGMEVKAAGAKLWLAGMPVSGSGAIRDVLGRPPRDAFTIWLYHYPDEIQEAAQAGVDLYLAGHTHGGQVALPFYGALVTFSRFDKLYERGLYQVGPARLYVSRGIGMEGGAMPRVRFCARPEIALIELAPGG